MINSNGFNKKIERMHDIFLSLIANEYESLFYDMLSRLDEKAIHQGYIKDFINESI